MSAGGVDGAALPLVSANVKSAEKLVTKTLRLARLARLAGLALTTNPLLRAQLFPTLGIRPTSGDAVR